MVGIRRLLGKGKVTRSDMLRDFQKNQPAEYKSLIDWVARKAFNDVIPRFHTLRAEQISPKLFTFRGVGNVGEIIELTEKGRQFLIEYQKLIEYVPISGWVRFTEQFTSAPKLHDKIEGGNVRRGAVSQWCSMLMAIQEGKCFYGKSHDMASSEVDHLLPWSFVLEDKTWNLVLACRKCNNEKRDRMAGEDALGRLCVRNEEVKGGRIHVDSAFMRHFSEWHSRDLTRHIRGLYDQAIVDGFPLWK